MCQLLETIKVFDNSLKQIQYHTHRVNQSRERLFGISVRWNLSELIRVPELDPGIVYRCRFLYSTEPEKIEFIPYVRKEVRKLYATDCGDLDYSFKYSDRRIFDRLRSRIPDPGFADILLIKDGLLTDTSIANIVLTDGNKWYTPASPLLKGTKRQLYIDSGVIIEKEIRWSDLNQYKNVRLINAMIDLDESPDIPVECIFNIKAIRIPGF
jgi:4-amino-4-deoxychorismate lyase